MKLSDFYFTGDDYRYRFNVEAKQRFIDAIRERFNAGVAYKGRLLKWDTVIEQKANELGRFLVGKSSALDFCEPAPALEKGQSLEREDSQPNTVWSQEMWHWKEHASLSSPEDAIGQNYQGIRESQDEDGVVMLAVGNRL